MAYTSVICWSMNTATMLWIQLNFWRIQSINGDWFVWLKIFVVNSKIKIKRPFYEDGDKFLILQDDCNSLYHIFSEFFQYFMHWHYCNHFDITYPPLASKCLFQATLLLWPQYFPKIHYCKNLFVFHWKLLPKIQKWTMKINTLPNL